MADNTLIYLDTPQHEQQCRLQRVKPPQPYNYQLSMFCAALLVLCAPCDIINRSHNQRIMKNTSAKKCTNSDSNFTRVGCCYCCCFFYSFLSRATPRLQIMQLSSRFSPLVGRRRRICRWHSRRRRRYRHSLKLLSARALTSPHKTQQKCPSPIEIINYLIIFSGANHDCCCRKDVLTL
jgi:hypothetical protein